MQFVATRLAVVLLVLLVLGGKTAFASTSNPGGKRYYVMSAGGADYTALNQVSFDGATNGTYNNGAEWTPLTTGRVALSGWRWDKNATGTAPFAADAVSTSIQVGADCTQTGVQRAAPPGTGNFNNGLPYQIGAAGNLRTARNFYSAATVAKTGNFYVDLSVLPVLVKIRWDDGTTENWSDAGSDSANLIHKLRFESVGSSPSLGYARGEAAGSNAPFTTRRHPASFGAEYDNWSQCTGTSYVLNESHYVSETSSNCSCSPKHSYKNQWLWRVSTTDRRDAHHLWCHCLAWSNPWYYGGSHEYTMLQAVDDNGKFRGHVAVEPEFAKVFGFGGISSRLDF